MTYKEKKERLEAYTQAMHRISGLQKELESWRTIATNITQKISPVIVNTNEVSSKVERCAIKCVEIQRLIESEIEQAEYERTMAKIIIDSIKDSRKRELLTLRYINDVSVRKIAILYDADENSIYKQIRRTIARIDL